MKGNPERFDLPRPLMGRPEPNFSLSGLKTALRLEAEKIAPLTQSDIADLCASFQAAVVDMVVDRTRVGLRAFREIAGDPKAIVVAGGVAANQAMRDALHAICRRDRLAHGCAAALFCGDNGAMIAWAGLERLRLGLVDDISAPARARWPLDSTRDEAGSQGLMPAPIGIAGAGAWGTALANVAAAGGHDVILWMRSPEQAEAIARQRTNERFLPGVRLHDRIRPTTDLSDLAKASAVLLVTPSQTTREMTLALAKVLSPQTPLVLCAKGIERDTNAFLCDVVEEVRPNAPVAVLSGPSFAADVARGLPTAVTLACRDGDLARTIATALSGPTFRVYHREDVRGVEIGGAAKNVLAIACGAVAGRGLGESAKAALIARGFAELLRFARAYGGDAETLMGLSGLGDLVLTCSSAQSRNFAFGQRLGQGMSLADAAAGKLVEGAASAHALVTLAKARGIDMPVSEAVDRVLSGLSTIDAAVDALMNRPVKSEE